MTVDDAIKKLQKISHGGHGNFQLLAMNDSKWSIVKPVKAFVECIYDKENDSINRPDELSNDYGDSFFIDT